MENRAGQVLTVVVILKSMVFRRGTIYRSLPGYRKDRTDRARKAVMRSVYIRGSLQQTCLHVEGLIEASSRSLMCAACTRSDWDISRLTVDY